MEFGKGKDMEEYIRENRKPLSIEQIRAAGK